MIAGCFCAALVVAGPARAEDAPPAPDAEEANYDTTEVQRLSEEAFKAFKALDFKKARQRLEKALAIAREGEPQSNPVVAKLRLYLGMILFVGFQNTEGAAAQFRVARRLDPGVRPPPGLFNPEVQGLFEKIGQEQSRTKPGGEAPATTPAPASGVAPDQSVVGSSSAPDLSPAARDAPANKASPTSDETLPSESELLAGKPASEAQPADAQPADAQPADAPSAPPRAVPSPAVADRPTRRRHVRADVAEREDEDEDEDEGEGVVVRPVFISLSVGSGAGASSGPLDAPGISPNRAPGRFGLAGGGHVSLGVGYFLSRSFSLALEGRLQIVPGTAALCTGQFCDIAPAIAAAGFARASYFFTRGAWRPFGSFGLGGGTIRQLVKLNGLNDCGPDHDKACVTTAAGGPLLGSLGAGIAYLGDLVMILAGVTANGGVPHLMVDVDLALGVGVRF
ncbi:MAG TPA: hypothetical protein VFH68_10410 [Polyangia bacterium]|nr:hypothetical protein [Polyangia bacterium]